MNQLERDSLFAMRPLAELLMDEELLSWDLLICQESDESPALKEPGIQFIRLQLDSVQSEIALRRRVAALPGAPAWPAEPPEDLRDLWRTLKDSIAIPDFWARYFPAFPLKQSGRNWRGPCPLHGGRNETSMSIYNSGRTWHCFTCGETGDLFTVAGMVYQTARFGEIAGRLAQEFGIEQPQKMIPPDANLLGSESGGIISRRRKPSKPHYPEFIGGRAVLQ